MLLVCLPETTEAINIRHSEKQMINNRKSKLADHFEKLCLEKFSELAALNTDKGLQYLLSPSTD
jgi:hypothetical protein